MNRTEWWTHGEYTSWCSCRLGHYNALEHFSLMWICVLWRLMTLHRVSTRRESADLWKVVLGLNNLDHPGVHSQTRGVRSIDVHPRYNRAVVDYDISVVQLDSEVSGHWCSMFRVGLREQNWRGSCLCPAGERDDVCQTCVSAAAWGAAVTWLLLLHHWLGSHGQQEWVLKITKNKSNQIWSRLFSLVK